MTSWQPDWKPVNDSSHTRFITSVSVYTLKVRRTYTGTLQPLLLRNGAMVAESKEQFADELLAKAAAVQMFETYLAFDKRIDEEAARQGSV